MRTTLNLDEDVLAAARSLAANSGRSLGAVVSDLIRKGLEPTAVRDNEYPTFEVEERAPIVTPDMVREALDLIEVIS